MNFKKDKDAKPKGTDKGGKGKGKGKKGAHSLEEIPESEEPEKESLLTLELATLEMLDLNAVEDAGTWIRMNLDSGSAGTVFPENAEYAEEFGDTISGKIFRTATGELIEPSRRAKFSGQDEYGQQVEIKGMKAPVHKPLVAAGDMVQKNLVILSSQGGSIINRCSPMYAKILETIENPQVRKPLF